MESVPTIEEVEIKLESLKSLVIAQPQMEIFSYVYLLELLSPFVWQGSILLFSSWRQLKQKHLTEIWCIYCWYSEFLF